MKRVAIGILAGASLILSGQSVAGAERHADGKKLFDHWCLPCHAGGTEEHPGTAALLGRYGGALPAALEERTDLVPVFVAAMVRRGIGAMAPFRPTDITDSDLTKISAYLGRNTKQD